MCCAFVGLDNKLQTISGASETKSYKPEGKLIKFVGVKKCFEHADKNETFIHVLHIPDLRFSTNQRVT